MILAQTPLFLSGASTGLFQHERDEGFFPLFDSSK